MQQISEKAQNWVDQQGGLPEYIKRIAKHLKERGMTDGHAIAVAVNAAKRMCATGDTNFPGMQHVNPGSKGEACAAVAHWEAMKASAHASSFGTEIVNYLEAPMEHLQLEAKATVTDQGVFSALFATYAVDRMGERIAPGAFDATIKAWQDSGKRIPLHWEHSDRPEDIIGYIDPKSMREQDDGVYVEGQIDLADSDVGRAAWRSMKNGTIGLSFGYLVQDHVHDGEIKELRKLDLFEITVTAKPVNADTRVLSMKSVEQLFEEAADLSDDEKNTILIVDPDSLFVKSQSPMEPAEPTVAGAKDLTADPAVETTEDEDAGEEPRVATRSQPRAQDPLADEVERELMDMRLHQTRFFNPLTRGGVDDVE